MKDPAYYRDIINRILLENDDDIPAPPNRKDLLKSKFLRAVGTRKIHPELWLTRTFYEPSGIQTSFHLGDNFVEAASWFDKNDKLKFDSIVSVSPNLEVYDYPHPNFAEWRKNTGKKMAHDLANACREQFGIEDTWTLVSWSGDEWCNWSCPKFAAFLSQEFSGIEYLLSEFTEQEIRSIVEPFIRSRGNT